MNKITTYNNRWLLAGGVSLLAITGMATAQDAVTAETATAAAADAKFTVNNLWLLISAFLVFIMHLGFATLESGLTQKKNCVNILFKNVFIITTGILTYYFWGFNAHYPGASPFSVEDGGTAAWNGIFAFGSPAAPGDGDQSSAYGDYTYWTDFIFQAMFAATAATIVSGAVAERVKLGKFMIFALLLVGIAYPLAGSWHWGTGILAKFGFYDFAGSTVVHAFGGFAALACCILLGARKGKYTPEGIKPILGHSMPLAAIGVFLLWLGWYGFNGGSVLNADPAGVSLVFVTTTLAACGGAVAAMIVSKLVLRKPDLSMALNGILAGLVGITAGADAISVPMSIVVGLIAGVIVVFSILFFDKIKIDDPVGAISVHGMCGIWGTLAVALFSSSATIMGQLVGIVMVCAFAFVFSFVVFLILKIVGGVRVSEEEEAEGLDVAEHGAPAYGLN
ncbi:MAG: ammonium transporter [Verrucomicrobiales bacterium]|nr:ammonium transporter [Verrucomicrobiales bacterium]